MTRVVLALGSNVGDSLGHLQAALDQLAERGITVSKVSGVYETAPIGGPEQERYLNAVVIAETAATPMELLATCQDIEAMRDRVRVERWGPRTLDIDVIAIDGYVSDDPTLTVPHPRAAERAFVCVPWLDIDPFAEIAGIGAVSDLVEAQADQDVARRTDLVLHPGSRA